MVLYHLLAREHQNLILMSHFAVEDRKIDAHLKTGNGDAVGRRSCRACSASHPTVHLVGGRLGYNSSMDGLD